MTECADCGEHQARREQAEARAGEMEARYDGLTVTVARMHAEAVRWRGMFAKYVAVVVQNEGVDFLHEGGMGGRGVGRRHRAARHGAPAEGGGLNDEDLTARIAELAAIIEAGLAADEATAKAAGRWGAEEGGACWISDQGYVVDRGRVVGVITGTATPEAVFAHIARNDPDRRRRDVKATRELVAEILAEGHHYDESDYYCCSQAREALYDGWTQTGEGPPGSACSDPERSGKPCDCGRDARAARRLGIIAAEWEG